VAWPKKLFRGRVRIRRNRARRRDKGRAQETKKALRSGAKRRSGAQTVRAEKVSLATRREHTPKSARGETESQELREGVTKHSKGNDYRPKRI